MPSRHRRRAPSPISQKSGLEFSSTPTVALGGGVAGSGRMCMLYPKPNRRGDFGSRAASCTRTWNIVIICLLLNKTNISTPSKLQSQTRQNCMHARLERTVGRTTPGDYPSTRWQRQRLPVLVNHLNLNLNQKSFSSSPSRGTRMYYFSSHRVHRPPSDKIGSCRGSDPYVMIHVIMVIGKPRHLGPSHSSIISFYTPFFSSNF